MLKTLENRVDMLLNRVEASKPGNMPPLPHKFDPRPYQRPTWNKLHDLKRAIIIWPRRAGKDKLCFNFMIEQSQKRVGQYYYIFPTYSQGKKAIWEGRDKSGIAFLDHVPPEIIDVKNNTELKLVLRNGSIIRIVGSDDIDALMGVSPVGCVFSEFALQHPAAWDYLRPIMAENNGWAIFNSTPRGKNHFYDLFENMKDSPLWHVSYLTIDDTKHISVNDLALEKAEMSDDIFQQEYYCSFTRGQEGSFYGKYLAAVEADGRITHVSYDPYALVDTFWDLGVNDPSVIIFAQKIGKEIHVIDAYEMNGEGLAHFAQVLQEKKYKYGKHYAPHDIKVRMLAAESRTRLDIAHDLGIDFEIVPNLSIYEGIELTRSILANVWFDEVKCKHLLKCLTNYVRRFNEAYNVYSDQPIHNWASHMSDGFRMLGITYSQRNDNRRTLADIEAEDKKYRRFV